MKVQDAQSDRPRTVAKQRAGSRLLGPLLNPRSKFWSAHDRILSYARAVGFGLCLLFAVLTAIAQNYDQAALLLIAAVLGWWWTR